MSEPKMRSFPQHEVEVLPTDSDERKKWCIYSGVVSPFPNALALVARLAYEGNLKHCEAGESMSWNFEASDDHHDCLMRHLMEEEYVAVAWRALALLEAKVQNNGYDPFKSKPKDEVDEYYKRNMELYKYGIEVKSRPYPPE